MLEAGAERNTVGAAPYIAVSTRHWPELDQVVSKILTELLRKRANKLMARLQYLESDFEQKDYFDLLKQDLCCRPDQS